ncbi:MAG: isopenicillin N synthase family oxygenase, partial [Rhodospirillales bacterium]|nr:isopenicillin N synthase family oxygenase [Rhodospirillales bacterium]
MPDTIDLAPGLASAQLDAIPVIDIAPLLAGDDAPAEAIGRACREIGFFYIKNHGIPQELIDRVYENARHFFALPPEEKEKTAIEHSACHRGWFRVGGENLDPAKQKRTGDLKEGFKIGRDLPLTHERVQAGLPLHGPNLWPDLPGWREVMQDYYDRMVALGTTILGAFAVSLGLKQDY